MFLDPLDLKQLQRVLGRLPPTGHGTGSRLKYTPSLPVKKAHLLVLQLQPERKVQMDDALRG